MIRDNTKLHLYDSPDAMYEGAAQRWIALAAESIARRASFHVALSGGSTPEGMYRCMADPPYAQRVDWRRVHIYFGDERGVPPDHPDSNYRMAKTALLQHVPIPATQIHRMAAESEDLEATAAGYAQLLAAQLTAEGDGVGRFDLVMLGLGPDGHVASLFPQTPVLAERERLVVPVYVDKLQSWRLTLTLPVINRARHVMLLVAGQGKASIMEELMKDHRGHPRYPVEMLQPQGPMEWYIDRAAAPFL